MTVYDSNNVFSKILRNEIPSIRVYEDESMIAFMDIMPQSPGHIVLVPRAPSRNLIDAAPQTLSLLMPVIQKLAIAVKSALQADGIAIMQFNEAASGQSIYHLHFHIIPHFKDMPVAPHQEKIEDQTILEEYAAKIRSALESIPLS